jgi:hypothetical protein
MVFSSLISPTMVMKVAALGKLEASLRPAPTGEMMLRVGGA